MTVSPGDILRVVAKMTDLNGSQIQNRYFYKHQGSGDVTNSAFLTAIETEMSGIYEGFDTYIPDTTTPLEIEVDKVAYVGGKLTTIGPIGTVPFVTWTGGEGSTDSLPQGVAAVVNFPTGVANVVGRKYFGPLVEASQANGSLVGAAITQISAAAVDLLAGFTIVAEDFDHIVMSDKIAGAAQILSVVTRAVLGYQRRRKAGRGI